MALFLLLYKKEAIPASQFYIMMHLIPHLYSMKLWESFVAVNWPSTKLVRLFKRTLRALPADQ